MLTHFRAVGCKNFALVLTATLLLTACGGGGGSDAPSDFDNAGQQPAPTDTAPPIVTISSPGSNGSATVGQTTVALTGTASDNAGLQSITWSNDRGGSGQIPVSGNWRSTEITLQPGVNTIQVTATDTSLNSATAVIRVNFDQATAGATGATLKVSVTSDLMNGVLLENATVPQEIRYFYLDPSADWTSRGIARVEFACCTDEADGQGAFDVGTQNNAPYTLPVNLAIYPAGNRRQISATVFFDDGGQSSKTASFVIAAQDSPNSSPVIEGTPPSSVTVGQTYNFMPTVFDPDGNALTLSVRGLPSWATFSETTGQITGAPTNNDVGTYTNVAISVSDGQLSAELPPFNIVVNGTAASSMTVNWIAPTARTDGSVLGSIRGYRILFGRQSGVYENQVNIDGGGLTSYTIDNLESGTWFVAMKTIDSAGLESDLSNEVSQLLN